jgi:hypothetical protein
MSYGLRWENQQIIKIEGNQVQLHVHGMFHSRGLPLPSRPEVVPSSGPRNVAVTRPILENLRTRREHDRLGLARSS